MKPILIIPPNTVSTADTKALRDNDICVVIAKDPLKIKFVDPIPAASSRNEIENAALKMSRILLNGAWGNYKNSSMIEHSDITKIFVDLLVSGTSLDKAGSRQEQEARIFDYEKQEELRRLARAEAKAEREAAKKKILEAETKERP